MTDSMVERVARTLARKDNIYHFDRDSDNGWEQEVERVRNTITAMREMTGAMVVAYNALPEWSAPPDLPSAEAAWHVMIDAALSNEQ